MLVDPKQNSQIILTTDLSGFTVGAIVHQVYNFVKQPLRFYSISLTSMQSNDIACDQELLAVYQVIKHFKTFCNNNHFYFHPA